MSAPRYLLDTNILVHYIRDSEVWRHIVTEHQPLTVTPTPLYCVISEGELRSLAGQWNWGPRKRDQIEFCLSFFQPQSIAHPGVMQVYAAIDADCKRSGHKMGDNDVWIAATAAVAGATLLTCDRDFDRTAPQFVAREWIDPDTR
jgi:predicted nucleic acid-binding protein